METVSPTRSSVRSSTAWATRSGSRDRLTGTLKRQGSIPRSQLDQAKEKSAWP